MAKKEKRTSIGGQAVLEGVMMRGNTASAIAVRDADGIIRIESERVTPMNKRGTFWRLPIVRGVVSFISSLVGGTKTLMRSADVYGEGEPSAFEKKVAQKTGIDVMKVVTGFSLILGLALAIALFVIAPTYVRKWILGDECNVWAKNFTEGGLKLAIFIGYLLLSSLLKDIRRTFMYHGAEHKTISCFESGMALTVENAKKCTRVHDRCGTTFIVFVMIISIILFAVFESLLAIYGVKLHNIVRVVCKIALLPLVAGLSYELLKGLAKTKSPIFLPLKLPGLLLQRITTREPDDKMLEVAIAAFNEVAALDADPDMPTRKFVVSEKRNELLRRVKDTLMENGIDEAAEAEWIVSLTLGVKRDELKNDKLVTPKYVEKIDAIVKERCTGRPLWYCIGDTDFYGYTIKTDERALIPRPETELLVDNALSVIKEGDEVLDLCTGSGAIAVAIAKKTKAKVTASDISEDALSLAKENAAENGAVIEFVLSDMFASFGDTAQKFDVIVSNPPYIKDGDIDSLQREIKDFEPRLALAGGKDGLDFYRIIAANVKKYLKDGGTLLLECGDGQAEDIKNMLSYFSSVDIIKDYEGIDRIVKAVL